jgi:hypothetical protein
MAQKIRYMTTLTPETIERMKQIGKANRWNDNDCIEVAIQSLHSRIFNSPNPVVTIEQVTEIANVQPVTE